MPLNEGRVLRVRHWRDGREGQKNGLVVALIMRKMAAVLADSIHRPSYDEPRGTSEDEPRSTSEDSRAQIENPISKRKTM